MKRLIAVLILLMTAIAVTACADRPCVEGHTIWSVVPVFTGKTTVLIPQQIFICDKYASKSGNHA